MRRRGRRVVTAPNDLREVNINGRSAVARLGALANRIGQESSDAVLPAALFLISIAILLFGLGAGPFSDWDEAVYAQIAHEMVVRGDFLTPTWQYVPFFQLLPSAPPLYLWEMAVPFALGWQSEFWARVPSALAGASLVAMTYLLARQAWSRPRAIVCAAILLATGAFLWYARYATLDMTLTALFYLGVLGLSRVADDRRWWYPVGVAFGLGFLAKHVGIVVLAGLGLLAFLPDPAFRRALRSRELAAALVLGVLLGSSWYVAMFVRYGEPFLQASLGVNILSRVTQPLDENGGSPFFYFGEFLRRAFPWSLLVPPALLIVPRWRVVGNVTTVMGVVLVGVIAVYTVLPTKLAWYIVPAYPAAAILVGGFLTDPRLGRLLVTLAARLAPPLRSPSSRWLGLPLLIALFVVSIVALPPTRIFARDQELRPYVGLAREIHRAPAQPLDRVLVLDADAVPDIVYYADRPAIVPDTADSLAASLAGRGTIPAVFAADGLILLQTCCDVEVLDENQGWFLAMVRSRR